MVKRCKDRAGISIKIKGGLGGPRGGALRRNSKVELLISWSVVDYGAAL